MQDDVNHVPFSPHELERRSDETPIKYMIRVFNNLPFALAGSPERAMCCASTFKDTPRRQFFDEAGVSFRYHTRRYMNHSAMEWYTDVDRACAAAGYSLDEVRHALTQWLYIRESGTLDERMEHTALFNAFITPIYVALRTMGYNTCDLWT